MRRADSNFRLSISLSHTRYELSCECDPFAKDEETKMLSFLRLNRSTGRVECASSELQGTTEVETFSAPVACPSTTEIHDPSVDAISREKVLHIRTYGLCMLNNLGANCPMTDNWHGSISHINKDDPMISQKAKYLHRKVLGVR